MHSEESEIFSNRQNVIPAVREVASLRLPTTAGEFAAHAFECASGFVCVALVKGDIKGARSVLARVHSECLTGDALGSLRCDCGVQLKTAMRAIAAEGRGVLVYATGHEGRGIGLIDKLRAYVEQDQGADTVDANLHLGLPLDSRDYREAAAVIRALGVASVRLMTNNPGKVAGLRQAGVEVESVKGVPTAGHTRNLRYLTTKQVRLGHLSPLGDEIVASEAVPTDVSALLGEVKPHGSRPYVVLKYAQTLDGRIATSTGDSKWISGTAERTISHALRARCDAVMVGIGTVLKDDPQLTVRLIAGASPLRVIVDSTLAVPLTALVLSEEVGTLVLTTHRADADKRRALQEMNVGVREVDEGADGVDLTSALRALREMGVESLLVEGGARLITSLLAASLVDRIIVAIAPMVIGKGTEGVGELGVARISQGLALSNRSMYVVDRDVVMAWDVGDTRSSA